MKRNVIREVGAPEIPGYVALHPGYSSYGYESLRFLIYVKH
jgi:hypothetical protein